MESDIYRGRSADRTTLSGCPVLFFRGLVQQPLFLSILSEIGKSQCGWGLILLFSSEGNGYEDYYRDEVWKHFEYLLHTSGLAGYEVIEPVKRAEQVSAPDGAEGLPCGEYDERDGEPAEGFDISVVCPSPLYVVHDVIKTAESGYCRACAGGEIPVFGYVYACGVGGCGVFTDGTQIQAAACSVDKAAHYDGDYYDEVDHEAVIEQYIVDIGDAVGQVLCCSEGGGCGRDRYLSYASRELGEASAEEIGDAASEYGERKSGDVLVGSQGYREEAVYESSEYGAYERAEGCDKQSHKGYGRGHAVLIQVGSEQSAYAAHVHYAGNAKVKMSRFLGHYLAEASVHYDRAERYGGSYERYYLSYDLHMSLLCPSAEFDLVIDEKLTSEYEEQYYALYYIGNVVREIEF